MEIKELTTGQEILREMGRHIVAKRFMSCEYLEQLIKKGSVTIRGIDPQSSEAESFLEKLSLKAQYNGKKSLRRMPSVTFFMEQKTA